MLGSKDGTSLGAADGALLAVGVRLGADDGIADGLWLVSSSVGGDDNDGLPLGCSDGFNEGSALG